MKKIITVDSYQPAMEFYQIVNDEFIPAIQSGNRTKASQILETKLNSRYASHWEAIDRGVRLAGNEADALQLEQKKLFQKDIFTLVLLAGIILLVVFALSYIISLLITKPLLILNKHLKLVSTGDFSAAVPEKLVRQNDEIGGIAAATDNMQQEIKGIIFAVMQETAQILQAITNSNQNICQLSGNLEY